MSSSDAKTSAKRRARGSLNIEQILKAAEKIAHDDGIEALSMPRLATELRAGVASIYWYFPNKDALLAELAKSVVGTFLSSLPVETSSSWRTLWESTFRTYRAALLRQPLVVDLIEIYPRAVYSPEASQLEGDTAERAIKSLVAAGVNQDLAAKCYAACWTYAHGFAQLEIVRKRDSIELVGAPKGVSEDEEQYLIYRSLSPDSFDRGIEALLAGIDVVVRNAKVSR